MDPQSISPPTIGAILSFGLIASIVFWIGWRRNFFHFPHNPWEFPIRFSHLIGAFAVYLLGSFFSTQIFVLFLKSRLPAEYLELATWFNFSTSGAILGCLIVYWRLLPEPIRMGILVRPEKKHPYSEDVMTALLAWFISFPLVLFLSNLLEYLVYGIFTITQLPDQLAVQFLKMTFNNPLHLFLATCSIVIFAPLLEELLFRGFLQSFIRQHLGTKQAILITSACFALFHYSFSQGLGNIPIVCSLFVLALFLGFLYEKQGSLLAPITLHASFNAVSVMNLYFLGGIHGGLFKTFGLSDIGISRSNNEDVWIALPEIGFFALADGMGGHQAGEVAAKEAVDNLCLSIQQIQSRDPVEIIIELRHAIEKANQWVYQLSKNSESLTGMGTTLCCLFWTPEMVIYAHVGDSRIYRYRDQKLELLTQDHSLFAKWLATGKLAEECETPFPYKNVITRAIGTSPKANPEIAYAPHQAGDLFFLCTDGLTDVLTLEEMEKILNRTPDLEIASKRLIEKAKIKGSSDNITILIIQENSDATKDLFRQQLDSAPGPSGQSGHAGRSEQPSIEPV